MTAPVLAWHFVGNTLRDGRPVPPDGEWLVHDGRVEMCHSGLHASRHPFDALQYAPGSILCWVECDDVVSEDGDKLVCRRGLRGGGAMSALLIIGAGLVVLAAAYYTWMVAFERREDAWQDTKHEADVLAQLAAERARNEMAERVHRLMREGRR